MSKTKRKPYYKPTSVKWRKVGDSILFTGMTMTGYAIFGEDKWFAIISLILTVAGKTITNLFTDDIDGQDQ
jgi:hypothetical protein